MSSMSFSWIAIVERRAAASSVDSAEGSRERPGGMLVSALRDQRRRGKSSRPGSDELGSRRMARWTETASKTHQQGSRSRDSKGLTVVRLEELDESVVEPQPILLSKIIERVLVVGHLEHVRPNSAEAGILAQAKDPAHELVGSNAALEDRVQRLAVEEERKRR